MSIVDLIAAFVLSFGVALGLVPVCRLAATHFGYTAKPREDRWHTKPTALLGGVAVAVTVLVLHTTLVGATATPVLLGGVALTFVVGLVDDVISLKPYAKFVAEIAIAAIFVFFGFRLSWVESLTVDTLLTMVWIVGITNAFNLLDNMDGLCAGIGLIAGSTLLVTNLLNGPVGPEMTFLVLLLGAMAAFIVYNSHPASIFLGDSGSLFIGVSLAVLTLIVPIPTGGTSGILSVMAGPLLILLVPIFDTTLVTVMRLVAGRSPSQGGRDHSSHRLVVIGLSERRAVAVLWALAGLGGVLALSIRLLGDWVSVGAAVFLLATIIFAVYLAQVRVYDEIDPELVQSGRITPFVVNVMYKRRIAEVALDACLVAIAYYAAWRLRFENTDFATYFPRFLESLPFVVGIHAIVQVGFGVYRGVWRYFGLMDAITLAKAVTAGAVANVVAVLYLYRFVNYSRGVFIIYPALLLLLMAGARASFRLIGEFIYRNRPGGRRLVIYGAGAGGAAAARELIGNREVHYRMLGFIDDDPRMARAQMVGYPVLGDYASLESLIKQDAVDAVVLSTRLIDVHRLDRLKELCEEYQVSLARLHYELDHLVAVS